MPRGVAGALGVVTACALVVRLVADVGVLAGRVQGGAWLGIAACTAVSFALWLCAAHRDLESCGYDAQEASHTALWCWVIPGFNGVQPALLAAEVWRGSGMAPGVTARVPWWVYAWWGCWLARIPTACLSVALPRVEAVAGAAVALHFVAGALAVALVAAVTFRRQRGAAGGGHADGGRPCVF